MSLTLFGSPRSGSAAVEMALRAADADYSLVRASNWDPSSARDELKRLSAQVQIPTLVLEDGTILTESTSILIHLGLRFPEAQLLPEDPGALAQTVRGLVFITANCYAPIAAATDLARRAPSFTDDPEDEATREAAEDQLHAAWDEFIDTFGNLFDNPPEPPGVLAFQTAVVSRWCGTRGHWSQSNPAFLKIVESLETHSRLSGVLLEHWSAGH
jgi:GST-like protein